MQLDTCPVDEDLRVLAMSVPATARLRMREVGLRVGSTVRVTHRAPFGGRVVAVGASRIALDGGTAARIEVGTPE